MDRLRGTQRPAGLQARLDAGAYGATILFKRNLRISTRRRLAAAADVPQEVCDLDALVALDRELHRRAPDGTPALIAIDQEGGLVQRVRAPATMWPPMMAHDGLPPGDDVRVAEQVGRAIGDELRALGFDIDFAPVLDVHTNPANPIIGDRAFGHDADTVVAARARVRARPRRRRHARVRQALPRPRRHRHRLAPRAAAHRSRRGTASRRSSSRRFAPPPRANLPMLMTAHVVFAALDAQRPATLSEQVVTGLLRDKLGYRGVIVSDDLDMQAIAGHMGADHAAVAAIRAGCDVLLLCCNEQNQALAEEGLLKAAESDSDLRRRIGESAARVRAMKRAHAANQAAHPAPPLATVVGSFEHRRLADRLAGV